MKSAEPRIFMGVMGAMFAIIMGMTAYIAENINGKIDMIDQRDVRIVQRINTFGERMAVVEDRLKIPPRPDAN